MERAPEKGIVKMRGKWKRNSGGKRKRRLDKETDKGICALPITSNYLTSSSTRLNLRVWLVHCDRGHGPWVQPLDRSPQDGKSERNNFHLSTVCSRKKATKFDFFLWFFFLGGGLF